MSRPPRESKTQANKSFGLGIQNDVENCRFALPTQRSAGHGSQWSSHGIISTATGVQELPTAVSAGRGLLSLAKTVRELPSATGIGRGLLSRGNTGTGGQSASTTGLRLVSAAITSGRGAPSVGTSSKSCGREDQPALSHEPRVEA